MSDVGHGSSESAPDPAATDNKVGNRAFLAGALAALAGGVAWALVVRLTDFEIGYVAVGVGFLVGAAMTRTTNARGRAAGIQAAGLAAIGLLFAKMLIVQWVTIPILEEQLRGEGAAVAATWQMSEARSFPDTIQTGLDRLGERDTLPDALWAAMLEAGTARAAEASDAERAELLAAYADGVRRRIGSWQLLWWQLGLFDVLWLFLALSTAYGMLARPTGEPAPSATADR
jgi:hypothetical protein